MTLDAAFDGKNLGLDVNAELADAGTFRLATKGIVIDGSPLEMSSWKRASGRAKFDARFDMEKNAALVPEELVPFSELRGAGRVSGTVRRDSAEVPPELAVHLDTRGLVVALGGKDEPPHDVPHDERVIGVQRWRSEGVDLSFDARVDATSGAGEVAIHAVDRMGTVAAVDVKADLPYQEVLGAPSRAVELLSRAPLSARLVVPKRALSEMPRVAGARARAMNGTFEAELTCVGTALEPQIDLVAHARGLRSGALSEKLASDVDVAFRYDGERGELVASASSEKRRVLDLSAHVDLRSRDLVMETGRPLDWKGSAVMKLAASPLESLGPLAARRVRGLVSGEASIADLHRDAKVHAELTFDRLKVGRAEFKRGNVVLDTRAGKLEASARLEQTDGYADMRATTDLSWGASLAPSIDARTRVDARLDAKAFRAAALLPFVKPAFNELDGRIDANVTAKIGRGEDDAALEGKIVFHDGTIQLAAFADELKEARATATFQPGGVIAIDDVLMRASDGELSAKGGVRTRGLALASASASLHLPDRKELDVSLQGRPLGSFAGDVTLEATSSDDGRLIRAEIDLPKMKIRLPQQMKSGVQDLEPKETIRVGTFRDKSTFVRLPLDRRDLMPEGAPEVEPGTVIEADVRLGDITITQGNLVSMVVGGKPHLRIAETTEVSGQIQVKQGRIDVQGKRFEIERGTATFNPEDPSNPTVVATAAWTADDGTKIYADFVGPVRTGKVTLRSDPGRPQNEILAMILFGTADGANAAPAPPGRAPDGTTRAATALGGAFAARGLTEAMDDLTGIPATARIDTTRAANPAPEIEIQIARRVSIAFLHILGTPPLSEPDTNLAIVNWRVGRNWSLAATVGDRGKVQSDAIWTKRC